MYADAAYKIKKTLAKKIIFTASISFPCLIVVGTAFCIVFLLPVWCFFWMANNDYLSRNTGSVLALIGLLVFISAVTVSSFYLWYLTSNIIYKRLDQKPISEFLNRDKVYIYLKPFLTKFKIINS
ncbi:hypothetical protein HK413_12905 [Mucilaginibacter sp. S1162]|uniref:Uncharacterized protein n=1 Tax=Mucilaginibacter humi TaxID=2732510 RepID=A0ABX1W608_9SPHI|nr:hypothetical protein [Mucilaginibacter humi]NNU34729.1 hypothetical protein [Mucilaginibacter humi]